MQHQSPRQRSAIAAGGLVAYAVFLAVVLLPPAMEEASLLRANPLATLPGALLAVVAVPSLFVGALIAIGGLTKWFAALGIGWLILNGIGWLSIDLALALVAFALAGLVFVLARQ